MSRKNNEQARKMRRSDYLAITAAVVSALPPEQTAGKLIVAAIAHDDCCPMMRGEDRCECEPEMSLVERRAKKPKIRRFFGKVISRLGHILEARTYLISQPEFSQAFVRLPCGRNVPTHRRPISHDAHDSVKVQ